MKILVFVAKGDNFCKIKFIKGAIFYKWGQIWPSGIFIRVTPGSLWPTEAANPYTPWTHCGLWKMGGRNDKAGRIVKP